MKKFIVIDGLDGCGKDTQVNLLAEVYKNQGLHQRFLNITMVELKSNRSLLKSIMKNVLSVVNVFPDVSISP